MLALINPSGVIVSLSGGRKTCAVGGVREQLSSTEIACSTIVLQALPTNQGPVAVGGADVSATAGAESGDLLYPTQSLSIQTNDIRHLWLDAQNSGEGVNYLILYG